MSPRPVLAYGARPREVVVPTGSLVVPRPRVTAPVEPQIAIEAALVAPIGSLPLEERAERAAKVLVVVSDGSRSDPRNPLLEAVRERLPRAQITVAVANGTHPPGEIAALMLPHWVDRVVNHDGADPSNIVELGQTSRGTPLRVNRTILEADLIIATGCIRTHYFAGFGAGVKAIFPGLGERAAIRQNHQLKQAPGARAGVVQGNPCRDDLEEIVQHLPPTFLLNAIADPLGQVFSAVAGDVVKAFRVGAERCREVSTLRAPRSQRIVVSDHHPVTASLYQASKLVAAVAPLLEDSGTVVLAAGCENGIGGGVDGVRVVNEAIYDIGLKPRLPREHRIVLVSELEPTAVAATYCEWAPTVEAALDGPATVIPSGAAYSICEPDP